uniref:Uncharacterized protein n=1 Tax=Anguilla anguilla TaxID=7936 RepID=A0A0E9TN56_ANGAN
MRSVHCAIPSMLPSILYFSPVAFENCS